MSCAACSARVERAVSALKGVSSCSVNLLSSSMTVEGDVSSDIVIDAVVKAGYGASLKDSKKPEKENNTLQNGKNNATLVRFILSLLLLIPLMYLSMGYTMLALPLPSFLAPSPAAIALIQLLISGVILVINQRFFISGVRAFLHLSPNMDTLVSLGSGASYIYSIAVVFSMILDPDSAAGALHGLYFESAAMILVLITLGKLLEERAKGKTTDAIRSLMSLAPKMATVLEDGEWVEKPASEVRVGDIFSVKPGEAVPVDGVITEGESSLMESVLTGESVPKDKTVGDKVFAATTNTSGFLVCRAERVGEDTALSSVIRLVDDATASKAPIAKIADRVSGVFVPIVMAIAAVTFTVWMIATADVGYSLARGISVLVISCPCALGLATPVAITVGSGVGARLGILYKDAEALENTARIKSVALDKTGTLTLGEPRVTDIFPVGVTEDELLRVAAAAEAGSEHPLAKAIVDYAASRVPIPEARDIEALAGSGVRARLGDAEILGGSLKFISSKTTLPDELRQNAERLAEEGKTPVFFTRGGDLIGYFALRDTLRPDAASAVEALHSLGIRVVMLTGDNKRTALSVAKEAGIPEEDVISDLMPKDKVRGISSLGQGVMMVGDGINDAPALATADVGVAIGRGTDIAIESADVVLLGERLGDIPRAIRLGRKTLKNIKENLFWAFIYNVIGIPIAAGVLIPLIGLELSPMLGALAMSLSSVTVVSNALRLGRFHTHEVRSDSTQNEPKSAESGDPCCEIQKADCKNTNENERIEAMQITIKIDGMMCPHCEGRVKKALLAVEGVTDADVSHERGDAIVTTAVDNTEALRAAVTDAGYDVVG